jgi:hypothetical protein
MESILTRESEKPCEARNQRSPIPKGRSKISDGTGNINLVRVAFLEAEKERARNVSLPGSGFAILPTGVSSLA